MYRAELTNASLTVTDVGSNATQTVTAAGHLAVQALVSLAHNGSHIYVGAQVAAINCSDANYAVVTAGITKWEVVVVPLGPLMSGAPWAPRYLAQEYPRLRDCQNRTIVDSPQVRECPPPHPPPSPPKLVPNASAPKPPIHTAHWFPPLVSVDPTYEISLMTTFVWGTCVRNRPGCRNCTIVHTWWAVVRLSHPNSTISGRGIRNCASRWWEPRIPSASPQTSAYTRQCHPAYSLSLDGGGGCRRPWHWRTALRRGGGASSRSLELQPPPSPVRFALVWHL